MELLSCASTFMLIYTAPCQQCGLAVSTCRLPGTAHAEARLSSGHNAKLASAGLRSLVSWGMGSTMGPVSNQTLQSSFSFPSNPRSTSSACLSQPCLVCRHVPKHSLAPLHVHVGLRQLRTASRELL